MNRRALLTLAAALPIAGCSQLEAFNALTPKDAGGRLAEKDVAYGPGARQRLDLYVPLTAPETPAPLLVFFYGGSWNSGDKAPYSWVGRALAAQGFPVAVPDYRLVPEHRFPAFLEDGAAAVAKARDLAPRHGGDPDRIVPIGHSAGAWLAIMLALDAARLEAAGVPERAIAAGVGLAGPYDFLPLDKPSTIEAFGRWPRPQETQPIAFARADAPPLLLATGTEDETVLPRHTNALADRLTSLGAVAERKLYPGVDHIEIVLGLSRPFRGKPPVLADTVDFVRRRAVKRAG